MIFIRRLRRMQAGPPPFLAHRENGPESYAAAHHVFIRLRGAVQRESLDHGADIAQRGEFKRLLAVHTIAGGPAHD